MFNNTFQKICLIGRPSLQPTPMIETKLLIYSDNYIQTASFFYYIYFNKKRSQLELAILTTSIKRNHTKGCDETPIKQDLSALFSL